MGTYFVIFSFQWSDITVYVKEEKESFFLGSSSILEEHPFMVRILPIIMVILSLFEPQPGRVWWKEPR